MNRTPETGTRTYFITRYLDETPACDGTLAGWAEFLSKTVTEEDYEAGRCDWVRDAATDGQTFDATAMLWQDDIIATRHAGGQWVLSRPLGENEFAAIRFGEGAGWDEGHIVDPNMELDAQTGEYRITETMDEALRRLLGEMNEICEGKEFIATAIHEGAWIVTYHATEPPTCTAERVEQGEGQ